MGVLVYKIEFATKAAKSYFKLPIDIKKQIDIKLTRIAENPYEKYNNVTPLVDMRGCYRLRVGDWRVIYEIINQTLTIYVLKFGQRKEIYRGL
jgi:mRNA interferase RelE/StbE